MKKFKIKQDDTKPYLSVTVKQDGTVVDLSNVTSVKFNMITADNSRTQKVNSTGEVVGDGTTGVIRYKWDADDTDTPGEYWGEFQMTWNTGEIQSLPEDDGLKITVTEDYGD